MAVAAAVRIAAVVKEVTVTSGSNFMSDHEAGDLVSVGQIGRVAGGFTQLHAGADHEPFVVSEPPPDFAAIRQDVVGYLERGGIEHVAAPVRINLFGEIEGAGISGSQVKAGAGQSGSGIGGCRFLCVSFVPPHPALAGSAAAGVPAGLYIRIERLSLIQITQIAGQIVGPQERQGHPTLVIVIADDPAALVLSQVEAFNQAGILLPASPLDAIQQSIPPVGVSPIAGQ